MWREEEWWEILKGVSEWGKKIKRGWGKGKEQVRQKEKVRVR